MAVRGVPSFAAGLIAVVLCTTLAAPVGAQTAAEQGIPYRKGEPIPPGYHLEKRTRTEVIVVGGVLLGVGALSFGTAWVCINHWDCPGRTSSYDALGWIGILTTIASIPVLAVGLFSKERLIVRDHPPAAAVTLSPIASSTYSGLAFSGVF